jgi:polyphosphate kinase
MSAAVAMVSIGDDGVLNREVSQELSDVWIDRDLGWLDFNDRVLAEALDDRTPLLERAKFLAIFSSNLDEFFMKRSRSCERVPLENEPVCWRLSANGCSTVLQRQADCFRNMLVPGLRNHGIHLRRWDELTAAQQDEASAYFDAEVSPALTPLVFDPAHPFPFLSNLSTSLAFLLHDQEKEAPELRPRQSPAGAEAMGRAEG